MIVTALLVAATVSFALAGSALLEAFRAGSDSLKTEPDRAIADHDMAAVHARHEWFGPSAPENVAGMF